MPRDGGFESVGETSGPRYSARIGAGRAARRPVRLGTGRGDCPPGGPNPGPQKTERHGADGRRRDRAPVHAFSLAVRGLGLRRGARPGRETDTKTPHCVVPEAFVTAERYGGELDFNYPATEGAPLFL